MITKCALATSCVAKELRLGSRSWMCSANCASKPPISPPLKTPTHRPLTRQGLYRAMFDPMRVFLKWTLIRLSRHFALSFFACGGHAYRKIRRRCGRCALEFTCKTESWCHCYVFGVSPERPFLRAGVPARRGVCGVACRVCGASGTLVGWL